MVHDDAAYSDDNTLSSAGQKSKSRMKPFVVPKDGVRIHLTALTVVVDMSNCRIFVELGSILWSGSRLA